MHCKGSKGKAGRQKVKKEGRQPAAPAGVSACTVPRVLCGSRVGAMGACTQRPPDLRRTMVILTFVVTLLPPSDCGCSKPQMMPRTMSLRMVARLVMGPRGNG